MTKDKKDKKSTKEKKPKPKTKARKKRFRCNVHIKHNTVDSINGKRRVSMYVQVKDTEGPVASGVNMNFSNMDEEKHDRLLMALGIKEFNENTPLVLELFVPEGALLTDWIENTGNEADRISDDQTTLES